jgi:hypothetical protein
MVTSLIVLAVVVAIAAQLYNAEKGAKMGR